MLTLRQMFEIEIDKRPMASIPSFIDDEIKLFFSKALLMLVRQKYTGHNSLQQGFESTMNRIAELTRFYKTITLTDGVFGVHFDRDYNSNKFKVNVFADDYESNTIKYAISNIFAPVSASLIGNSEFRPNKQALIIDHATESKMLISDINYPYLMHPAIVFDNFENNPDPNAVEGDKSLGLSIIVDPDDIDKMSDYSLKLSYLYIPSSNVNIDLDNTADTETQAALIHELPWKDEVVSLAVDLALDNIESPRIQSHSQLVTSIQE